MSNFVNLVNALLGSKFDIRSLIKLKIGHLSSIIDRCTCLSSFDVQKMMFEFVRCSVKMCLYHKELIKEH